MTTFFNELYKKCKYNVPFGYAFLEEYDKKYLIDFLTKDTVFTYDKNGKLNVKVRCKKKNYENLHIWLDYICKNNDTNLLRELRKIIPNFREIFGSFYSEYTFKEYKYDLTNAIIAEDGKVFLCKPCGHKNLFPFLNTGGYEANYEFEKYIFISGSIFSYAFGYLLDNCYDDFVIARANLSLKSLGTLWYIKDNFEKINLSDSIRRLYTIALGNGSKYGNLKFIEKFYPNISLPKVSDNINKYPNIRTSPINSQAGHFDSVFNIKKSEIGEYVTSQKAKGQCYFFSQDYVEGHNGFANFFNGKLEYAVSPNRNGVAKSETGSIELTEFEFGLLNYYCIILYNDFKCDFQLEFVVTPYGSIVVVQFRTLKTKYFLEKPEGTIIGNNTYRTNNVLLEKKNIFIPELEDFENINKLYELKPKVIFVRVGFPRFAHLLIYARQQGIGVIHLEKDEFIGEIPYGKTLDLSSEKAVVI